MDTRTGDRAGLRAWLRRVVPSLAAILALVALPLGALAHENRTVGNGNYTITVGFLNEPAFVGQPNGLYFKVVQIGGGNAPVEDLQNTLKADVTLGPDTRQLTITPIDGAPGAYVGAFVPTAPGDYTFHITGQIADQAIDETFRSSPNTFDAVQPATLAQFPAAVPAGTDLNDELQSAKDDASSARTLAYVGIGVGVAGLLAAAGALALGSRRPRR